MPGHRNFRELRAGWSSEREERAARRAEATLASLDLQDLARSRGLTQEDLAERMDKAQGNISRALRRNDMRVSTLREVVAAMGGELEVVARFPDQGVLLSQFDLTTSRMKGSRTMAPSKRNEKTSGKVAKVAGKVLQKGKATAKEAKTLAASALTQAADKSKKSKGKK